MIDPASFFSLAGLLAMAGWLGLLVALFVKSARPPVWAATQLVVPAIICLAYGLLIWNGRAAFGTGGFGSIVEVRALFTNDSLLAAGWLHYLAFDLFVGTWISRDGTERGVPALLILLCLPLTFMVGPLGLLLYLALRLAFSKPSVAETA
jgi:hypothetical protein